MVGSGRRFLGKHFLMMRLEVFTRGSSVRTGRHSWGPDKIQDRKMNHKDLNAHS